MDILWNVFECNPTVKLKKWKFYPLIDIDSIQIWYKYPIEKEKVEYTWQSASKFQEWDTIMARITPCLENGKLWMVKTDAEWCIWSTELFVFRWKEWKSINEYVYYFMKQDWVRNYSANSMTWASWRQRADLKFIKKLKFDFPTIEKQETIANILSKYDDQIENNNKRIKKLEEIIEEIYKERFIRFRFPWYKDCKIENRIPSWWEIKRVKDFWDVVTWKTPSTSKDYYYWDEYLFVKTPDMHDNIFVIATDEMLSSKWSNSQKACLLPINSIMVSCIWTWWVVAINKKPWHTNQQINSVKLYDENKLYWLYMTLKWMKETITMFWNTWATMTNLSKWKFERLKLIKPTNEIIYSFNNITKCLFDEIYKLQESNVRLIKQRDLLLPRLMSWKLEVKSIE